MLDPRTLPRVISTTLYVSAATFQQKDHKNSKITKRLWYFPASGACLQYVRCHIPKQGWQKRKQSRKSTGHRGRGGELEQKPNWTKKPKARSVFFLPSLPSDPLFRPSASLIQTTAATSKRFLLVLSYTRVFSSRTKHASPCFEHFGQHQPHRCPSLQPQEQMHYTQVCDSRMKRADTHM